MSWFSVQKKEASLLYYVHNYIELHFCVSIAKITSSVLLNELAIAIIIIHSYTY